MEKRTRHVLRGLLILAAGLGGLHAGEEAWPAMGPLPEGLDKSQAPPYHGKTVAYFTPEQRKALWDARVRKDHPRILITSERLPALREAMKSHPAWPHLRRLAGEGAPLANAFVFLLEGDNRHAAKALSIFDDGPWKAARGEGSYEAALVFDWCFPAIPAERMEEILKKLAASGTKESETDQGATGPAAYQRLRWSLGSGYERGQNPGFIVAHSHLALAHHWPGAETEYLNWWHPDGAGYADHVARDAFYLDGAYAWFPSMHKTGHNYDKIPKIRLALQTGTGLDTFDEVRWGSGYHNMLYWILYNSELEGGHILDHFDPYQYAKHTPDALRLNAGAGTHMMNLVKNPHYQWYLNRVAFPGGPVEHFKNHPMRLVELALFYDPSVPEKKPAGIPYGRFLAPGEMQEATFRSGFNGAGDAIAIFNFSDRMTDHDQLAQAYGNFILYKDEYLATHSATSPLRFRTWGLNNLVFVDTSARDAQGFDKPLDPFKPHSVHTLDFVKGYPDNVRGTVEGFESHADYDYVGMRSAPGYWPASAVKEWTRQAVFLRPGVVVLFDRTEVADPKFQPRWLMQIKGERPELAGSPVHVLVPGRVEDFDTGELAYLGHLHRGRLHLKVLLPAQRHLRLAHGHLRDAPASSLKVATKSLVAKMSNLPGDGGSVTWPMKVAAGGGDKWIDALRVGTAVARKPGNFTVEVKATQRLRVLQTAADKDETIRFQLHPTLQDVAAMLRGSGFQAQVLAAYEHWYEGRYEVVDTPYDGQGRLLPNAAAPTPDRRDAEAGDEADFAPAGEGAGHRADILRAQQSGHVEVRLPGPGAAPRQYFLNVITLTNAAADQPAIPEGTLEEDDQAATAVLRWKDGSVSRVTFRKQGGLGGRVKIEKDGAVVVERDLATRLDFSTQAFGTDFLNGKRQ